MELQAVIKAARGNQRADVVMDMTNGGSGSAAVCCGGGYGGCAAAGDQVCVGLGTVRHAVEVGPQQLDTHTPQGVLQGRQCGVQAA